MVELDCRCNEKYNGDVINQRLYIFWPQVVAIHCNNFYDTFQVVHFLNEVKRLKKIQAVYFFSDEIFINYMYFLLFTKEAKTHRKTHPGRLRRFLESNGLRIGKQRCSCSAVCHSRRLRNSNNGGRLLRPMVRNGCPSNCRWNVRRNQSGHFLMGECVNLSRSQETRMQAVEMCMLWYVSGIPIMARSGRH